MRGNQEGEDKPIDFARMAADAMHIGLSLLEFRRMYIGTFFEIYEEYKRIYNFETAKRQYVMQETTEEKKITSIFDL